MTLSRLAIAAALCAGALACSDPPGTVKVSLPRTEIDVVVTEFGAADLRGASVLERAERLIAIAAPQHRGALEDAHRASNSSRSSSS